MNLFTAMKRFSMKRRLRFLLYACLLALGAGTVNQAVAAAVEMTIPKGYYAKKIGKAPISDPSGTTHTRQEIAGKVVVGIFSAPNMTEGGQQEKWSDLLSTQPESKVSDAVVLILVEDMTQAGMFKGMALSSMKKQFSPHQRPFLVLDQTGAVFKRFGVPENKTAILIYDKTGRLRDVEVNLDDQKTTVARIQAITTELLED
jgi:hypothetical protein